MTTPTASRVKRRSPWIGRRAADWGRLAVVAAALVLLCPTILGGGGGASGVAAETPPPSSPRGATAPIPQWGQFGGVRTGREWLAKEVQSRMAASQDQPPAADPRATRTPAQEAELEIWARPSPATPSGFPPVVVHIPMRDDEGAIYQEQRRRDSVSRLGLDTAAAQRAEPDRRDLHAVPPVDGHGVLPAAYVDRVRALAEAVGCEWRGLAAAGAWPDRHVLWPTIGGMTSRGLANGQNQRLPPREPAAVDEEAAAVATDTAHERARRHHEHVEAVDRWRSDWHEWATDQTAAGSETWLTRLDAAQRLRDALLSVADGAVAVATPQHPEPRVLRYDRAPPPMCRGRAPTMWHGYRERWDAAGADSRPARQYQQQRRADTDSRTNGVGGVGDPMLTEQWNLYDAANWGDLPPGAYAHRPSMSAGPQCWDRLGLDGTGVGIGVVDSGIEVTHPELSRRYARATSYDALNPTRDRPPAPVDVWTETHGTQAAGVAVAERGNGYCGAGVAPGARLGAVRLLGLRGPTDAEEAAAISHACAAHGPDPAHNLLLNHVFSCSWGPPDDGADLRGPGPLAAAALESCVHGAGRHGKGSIYVWAGGNGRTQGDNVNYDGYANRPETVAVGALDDMASQAWYSEPGACLMLVAPSSGGSSGVVTADPSGPPGLSAGQCTRGFGGTSAAAPAVAGVVAMMLQAAPDLGWRDVQHLLIRASERINPRDPREPWTQNGAGLWHSHGFGFGLINATRAVSLASSWRPLEPREALRYTTAALDAAATWDREHGETQRAVRHDEAARPEAAIDTSGLHHPARRQPVQPDAETATQDVVTPPSPAAHPWDEPLEGDLAPEPSPEQLHAATTEHWFKSTVLFPFRLLGYHGRKFKRGLDEQAETERRRREAAQRDREPNTVRALSDGHGLAVPPGFAAHFEWTVPEGGTDPDLAALEHVGLRLHALTPAGRGLLRIWLCAPSGTCSLMAPAPHVHDTHGVIDGASWTYWSVRHWGEPPRYDAADDRTGHGPGTWSLRLTHTWPPDAEKARALRITRVQHPERVDVTVRWWQLEFRGTADKPAAI